MADNILVIGGKGFIASHLVRSLVAQGVPVLAVVPPDDLPAAPTGVRFVAEPKSHDAYASLLKTCRAVVHAASRTTPGESAGRGLGEVQSNLVPLVCLLEAMQDQPLPLLYLSSAGALYDAAPGHGAREDADVRPRSYYGAGKLAAEFFIRAWAEQTQGHATLLRPSNVYGPGQSARKGFGIVPTAMDRLQRGEAVSIWGDGSTRRDYLFIDEMVDLCMRILAAPMPAGVRTINAASGKSVSLVELLSLIERVTGRVIVRRFEPARSVDAPSIAIDPSLAMAEYGWLPTISLEEGLRRTWNWFGTTAA